MRSWVSALLVGATITAGLSAPTYGTTPQPALARKTAMVDTPVDRERPRDRGEWRIAELSAGEWRIAWRAPSRLPTTGDRPRILPSGGTSTGMQIRSGPSLDQDGRTVTIIVGSTVRPDPSRLDVVLSGRVLDSAGLPPVGRQRPSTKRPPTIPRVAPQRTRLPADPGRPGPHAVVSSDYDLPRVKLAGMPEPIEMVGHVVEPTADANTGPRPLVLFLHGRHSYCYQPGTDNLDFEWPCAAPFTEIPSHLGYDYIQRLLASQGFATVSVRVNGINAQDFALDDGGAGARASIVRRHLDYWSTIAAEHQVDLRRTVLVGHSRGGEGVDRATIQIPLSAQYRVVGQVLIAPTDFGTQTAPYVPTVTMLPYCDGDVTDLQGQRFTDTGRDLTTDDTSLKSSVLVMGANHNFFNTEWTPGVAAAPAEDDWFGKADAPCGKATPDRLTAAGQRKVGAAYVAGAARLFSRRAEKFLPMYDGSPVSVASAGSADLRTHAIGGGRVHRKPALGTTLTSTNGDTQFCRGVTDDRDTATACGRGIETFESTPHWPFVDEGVPSRPFFEFAWSAVGQAGGMSFAEPLDLSGGRLEMRTIVDPVKDVRLRVRLTDVAGNSTVLTPENDGNLPALLRGEGLSKRWAQTLLVTTPPVDDVDLTRIGAIELIGQSTSGRVWVADVAAAPAALATVPARRAPQLSMGDVRQVEGDGPGTVSAEVPFTITGTVDRPAQFRVVIVDQETGERRAATVDVSPGQTRGNVDVAYEADQLDDEFDDSLLVGAVAMRELMTDDYLGSLTVIDDDPTPKILVRRVKKKVREGQRARWRVTLARPVDYYLFVEGDVVRGRRPMLRGGDVPVKWLRDRGARTGSRVPLYKLRVEFFDEVPRGRRSTVLSIPIRRDGVREKREFVTLRLEVNGKSYRKTIAVAPSP
jgi:hypothetical protein